MKTPEAVTPGAFVLCALVAQWIERAVRTLRFPVQVRASAPQKCRYLRGVCRSFRMGTITLISNNVPSILLIDPLQSDVGVQIINLLNLSWLPLADSKQREDR
jgi:hypothetical protein